MSVFASFKNNSVLILNTKHPHILSRILSLPSHTLAAPHTPQSVHPTSRSKRITSTCSLPSMT